VVSRTWSRRLADPFSPSDTTFEIDGQADESTDGDDTVHQSRCETIPYAGLTTGKGIKKNITGTLYLGTT
jgi:hypothetical protein